MIEVRVHCDVCGAVERSEQPDHRGPLGAVELAELELGFRYEMGRLHCSRCVRENLGEILASIRRARWSQWRRP